MNDRACSAQLLEASPFTHSKVRHHRGCVLDFDFSVKNQLVRWKEVVVTTSETDGATTQPRISKNLALLVISRDKLLLV